MTVWMESVFLAPESRDACARNLGQSPLLRSGYGCMTRVDVVDSARPEKPRQDGQQQGSPAQIASAAKNRAPHPDVARTPPAGCASASRSIAGLPITPLSRCDCIRSRDERDVGGHTAKPRGQKQFGCATLDRLRCRYFTIILP